MSFKLVSEYSPKGDQEQAIEKLVKSVEAGNSHQTLMGVTGSGKTFTMANLIERIGKPALVMSHNKTLAAQLYSEFKNFFPNNAVEYFVSYFDYFQPEAYIPRSDTYIEKDSSINDEIERLRLSTMGSLLTRADTIVVASVSCIYGLGSPDDYEGMMVPVWQGQEIGRDELLSQLVAILFERNDIAFGRGKFRVRGDVVEVHPAYLDATAIRVEFFGDEIDRISTIDVLNGAVIERVDKHTFFPAKQFVSSPDKMQRAMIAIRAEMEQRVEFFEKKGKLIEAQRLKMRTEYDLEMMQELGYCNGIENYSGPIDGRGRGEPPYTLIDYFPEDFLLVIDESHVAVPQLRGQYEGDRSRKATLIDHGFRLPSAADNRPLTFDEVMTRLNQVVFLSATPSKYELDMSSQVVEQIVRPTGLIDPEVIVKPTKGQIDDLHEMIKGRTEKSERVLVTTLTKKMAEDLTDYLLELGVRVRYLHSEIDTIQRIEILRDLRLGEFDVLVGINLLREGLDLPEVSLVAILDADKEGFLRSQTSLIQMIGRAARNVAGQVVMYADQVTDSMQWAISETMRRRGLQQVYNIEHNIDPTSIRKEITDILSMIRPAADRAPVPEKLSEIGKKRRATEDLSDLPEDELERLIRTLETEMHDAAVDLRFEYAARLRDEIKDLKRELREMR